MKYKALFIVFFFGIYLFAQNVTVDEIGSKTNPVLFSEAYFGGAGSAKGGLWLLGYNINYELPNNNLLTARYAVLLGVYENYVLVNPLLILPFSVRKETQQELALLYGKRWTNTNFSYSFSAGISYTNRNYYDKVLDSYQEFKQDYFGFPFECNIKWFKPQKKIFRAYYGLIPIGKRKVSFGRSVGFKLIGNVTKNNYIGLSITYGFGWHKKY